MYSYINYTYASCVLTYLSLLVVGNTVQLNYWLYVPNTSFMFDYIVQIISKQEKIITHCLSVILWLSKINQSLKVQRQVFIPNWQYCVLSIT